MRTSLLLIDEIRRQHPREFAWGPTHRPADRIGQGQAGDRRRHSCRRCSNEWDREAAEFVASRKPYLLY